MATANELLLQSKTLLAQAQAILEDPNATTEQKVGVTPMIQDAKRLQNEAAQLQDIIRMAQVPTAEPPKAQPGPQGFKNLGDWLSAVRWAGDIRYRGPLHPGLVKFKDPDEGPIPDVKGEGSAWEPENKALAEGAGATGGFLVPTEYRPDLYGLQGLAEQIRSRATIIPMRRRSIQMPVVDQTGTTAGSPHWFGGIKAQWTEEAALKAETDPAFRLITLVAHKLVCKTYVSDELMEDSAVSLAAFLSGPMGFAGAIDWQESYCFLRGTGVGQPLGIINAGATINVPAQAAAAVGIIDIVNMVSHIYGNPVWHISQSCMPDLLQLNGPAANPSYVFIPNAREGMPATLFGFPIIWTDKLPALGTSGSIVLADWKYYLIGDRQQTTIDSTNAERFSYDQTTWRAVHRVDGQPWLSTWFTMSDGASDVSPFVILGAKTT